MALVAWAGNVENGAIPTSKMVSIGTYQGETLWLNPAAAHDFKLWAAEWKQQEGEDLIVDEADRSLDRQIYLYNGYTKHMAGFYMAAYPGTSSHGEALAIDVLSSVYGSDEAKHDRLVAMGLKYGWSWYTVGKPSGEPWHFNYIRNPLQQYLDNITNAVQTVIDAIQGEDEMPYLVFRSTSDSYLTRANRFYVEEDSGLFHAVSDEKVNELTLYHGAAVFSRAIQNAGADLDNKFRAFGFRAHAGDVSAPGAYTGQIIGGNASNGNPDTGTNDAHWPRVSA
ncbi:M15 family metallopeptidase [Subtercola sp. RTI3]|uniref:M15 family metallopeptidase n=1 Tax=Subtercola sp. RTI3 TaxID=3048639 RepID=UPI002B23319C|nr:M15 family metallopeptidase [Subtercola sp. RTI3]MEA9986298.1 M15 family metallopeptidase [Subtercola sp. RTI3]